MIIPDCPVCCRKAMDLKSVIEIDGLAKTIYHYYFQCKVCGKIKMEIKFY